MYIRLKKRFKKDQTKLNYAYLVSSKRKYKEPRQKIIKYLGQVIELNLQTVAYTPEDKNYYISKNDYKSIIKSLIKNELIQSGFQKINDNLFLKDNIIADLINFNIKNKSKSPIVIKINDGFLCKYTVNQLINFKFENKTQKECINLFANQLVSTGINIDKELFILLFKKIYPHDN